MKISIVIATYNSELYVKSALDAAVNQTYENIEIIVVDGASTDRTLDIISEYSSEVILISEKDEGISDAWNKGVSLCTGEFVYFLNSDDYIDYNFIENIVKNIQDKNCIYYGDTELIETNGDTHLYHGSYATMSRYKGFGFYFTSLVIPTYLLKENHFNTSIRIAIDTEWLFRIERHVSFSHHNEKNYMRQVGVSHKFRLKAYREYFDIMKRFGYSKFVAELYFIRMWIICKLRS